MATNATFNWIAQSNIVAQEVWYGALSTIGSTFPPAAGWNAAPGNLLGPTVSSVTINNLNENTPYQLAVLSHCTIGQSNWAILSGYKLVCPTIAATSSATTVSVTLTTLFPSGFASIINTLSVALVQVSSGATVSIASYSGSALVSLITNTFTGLAASTAYNVVVSYTLTVGGSSVSCSTTAISTIAAQSCPVISFSVSNVTTTGFTITPIGLQAGDTYDISLDNGSTFVIVNGTQPSMALVGLTPGTTYTIVIRRDCANTLTSVSASQQVTTILNNFTVGDVWYPCPSTPCNGQAIWASTAVIKQTSNSAVIYSYTNNPSIPNGFSGFVPGLVPGTQYTLTATWVINSAKTVGISAVFLTGNTVNQNWGTSLTTITESITFTASTVNNISVQVSSRGSTCVGC